MIPEQDEWVFFKDIDFGDADINTFSVDTRDFHVGYRTESAIQDIDYAKISKYEHFFHTPDEVRETLLRLFDGSGGSVDWRFLAFLGEGARHSKGWELKYLRIIKTPKGLVICNNEYYALSKSILNSDIDKGVLCAH